MNEKDNFVKSMLQDWQRQMQQHLSDPRTAELLVEQYAKTQQLLKQTSDMFSKAAQYDADNHSPDAAQLAERVDELEHRVLELERMLHLSTQNSH
jgi:hypothetical protein